MHFSIQLLPHAISEMIAQIGCTRQVTLADRYGLMAAIFYLDHLSEDERFSIDRLLRSICRGRIQVVDEISALLH